MEGKTMNAVSSPNLHAASISKSLRRAGFGISYAESINDGVYIEQAMSRVRIAVKMPDTPERAEQIVQDLTQHLNEQGYAVTRHPRGPWPVLYVSRPA